MMYFEDGQKNLFFEFVLTSDTKCVPFLHFFNDLTSDKTDVYQIDETDASDKTDIYRIRQVL